MPANHPNPRRLLGIIALVVLLLAFVPAVSAADETVLIDEIISDYSDTSVEFEMGNDGGISTIRDINYLRIKNIETWEEFSYLTLLIPLQESSFTHNGDNLPGYWVDSRETMSPGRHEFTYYFNGKNRPGVVYVTHYTNILGKYTWVKFDLFLNDWDTTGLTGTQIIELPFSVGARNDGYVRSGSIFQSNINNYECMFFDNYLQKPGSQIVYGVPRTPSGADAPGYNLVYGVAKSTTWKNRLQVIETTTPPISGYEISLYRDVDKLTSSTIEIYKNDEIVASNTAFGENFYTWYPTNEIDLIKVRSFMGKEYTFPLTSSGPGEPGEPGDPDGFDVTVYVRNSQTGALLADAHILVKDTTTDPWTEVVNQTLPSGYGTISLPKDPGFNPTQYHINATVPGYQQVVPAHFFRVVGPMSVVVEMEPLEGGPVNEDNTFLEFYVRDLNANGISNAQVFVDGQLRWTNAQGYTQFEVAKNASYPYTVSKSGYVTIEGTATVADGPRYVVNVVLGPKEIPTYTPDPGETPGGPGATPTPDRRTNEEKGQAVIDMLADNAEGLGALALICLMFGLLKLMVKW